MKKRLRKKLKIQIPPRSPQERIIDHATSIFRIMKDELGYKMDSVTPDCSLISTFVHGSAGSISVDVIGSPAIRGEIQWQK